MGFRHRYRRTGSVVAVTAATLVVLTPGQPVAIAAHTGGVTYTDIATAGTSLADYRRAPSPDHALREANRQKPVVTAEDFAEEPVHDRGLPGIVLFDYDNDGDSDLFVTNGPGRPMSLYRNDLHHGHASFVDVAAGSGLELTAMDANGACAGDLDNDGNIDLYVLGRNEPDHLLQNLGHGKFRDITESSHTAAGNYDHISCTMADFDNDGKLDIAVANTWPMKDAFALLAEPYKYNDPNQMFHNDGHLAFTDVSDSSGFTTIDTGHGMAKLADISWAIAAVDIDQDGDQDLVVANDQGAIPMIKYGGMNRGFNRVWRNDGHGHFTDVTYQLHLEEPGAWMGLSFGDFNFDGTIDMFSTNFGDYVLMNPPLPQIKQQLGDWTSRWLLQNKDGTFTDPRRSSQNPPSGNAPDPTLGGLNATPFGWGTSTLDYDNDGATDILYHGSLDAISAVTADNPGALLHNEGPGAVRGGFLPTFNYDDVFTKSGADHSHRTVIGVATGDLDHNGFEDVVTVASSENPGELTPYHSVEDFDFHSPFDNAEFLEVYAHIGGHDSVLYTPTGKHTEDGNLAVEMNNGGNGNHSVSVRTKGSIGFTPKATVNRDGIGAVVKFTPAGGPTAIRPVIAGSSFASQDELAGTFGMGKANKGTVDVLWPGGVRNKLYDVRAGERITMPEIPCSYADKTMSPWSYGTCVTRAVRDLVKTRQITLVQGIRLTTSALRAYHEAH